MKRHLLLSLAAILMLSACSSGPARLEDAQVPGNERVVRVAHRMVGVPYRYGGATPRGFDCSGLVYFAYGQTGRAVPRTAASQFARTHAVHPTDLRAGDLLFFSLEGKPSHVGLYVGGGRFIHAPSSGKSVGYASLDNPYWNEHLVKVGRF